MSTQYDYKDFVYPLSPQSTWCNLRAYTEADARLEFWQSFQSRILPELQKELDDGWETIGEVGPAGISIQTKKEYFFEWGCMSWALYIFVSLASWGIGFIVFPFLVADYIARPVGFRVGMRRRQRQSTTSIREPPAGVS